MIDAGCRSGTPGDRPGSWASLSGVRARRLCEDAGVVVSAGCMREDERIRAVPGWVTAAAMLREEDGRYLLICDRKPESALENGASGGQAILDLPASGRWSILSLDCDSGKLFGTESAGSGPPVVCGAASPGGSAVLVLCPDHY